MSGFVNQKYRALWIGAAGLVLMPVLFQAIGLTLDAATVVVILAMAAMGLNLLVGYSGLVSFGHSAWFGIGGYAAALAHLHWFKGQFIAPLLFSLVFTGLLALAVGFLILRRRGVYFSLLTLALCALTFAISFRWTSLTGGEGGLGGIERGTPGLLNLDDHLTFYAVVALIGFAVLYALLRVVRSPFGHVLVAIRENEQRALFQGYNTDRYKLVAFVLSACMTGLAGALLIFLHRLAAAESTTVAFSGELLAMVVIGGMRSFLGPALGALFFLLFRELFSIYTDNWLLWFGLIFVGFIIFSPTGLTGIWAKLRQRFKPLPQDSAAMSRRQIFEGLPLPAFLRPASLQGTVLQAQGIGKHFGGIQAVKSSDLSIEAGQIHSLIGPNGAGKTTTFNLISGMFMPDTGTVLLRGKAIQHLSPDRICQQGLARSFQITNLFKGLSIYENLRLSLQARHAARLNWWRDIDHYPEIHAETAELMKFLGLQGMEEVQGGGLSYGGQRLVDLGIALGSKPQVLLLDEPLAGLAAAERERVSRLVITIASNIPVLIVEHDIDRVLSFSHRVTVMNQGEVLMSGTPEAVRLDQRVQEIYTGTGTPPVTGRSSGPQGERPLVLDFEKVNAFYGKSHILNDASLQVREGEIVALLGRNGAGKTTLLKSMVGLLPPASGRVNFAGTEIAGLHAPDIARLGIGYVPQGRGLFAGMTVAENLALGRLARKTDGSCGVVWSEEKILAYFPRLKERMHVAADYLSGGEQQMVAVARALSGNVSLLLLDEPFEGLAPTVVQELFTVFDKLRQHVSIVIVEHNLDLVLALADRVYALERGTVFHEGPAQPLLTDLDYRKKILWL
ncbi:MAG: ATP-binding cassette domain-containing protein [Gammaproteobacteria bacterium]|nr:ATP-binding cassette domain-containing protein [Gammaproteobacteria bacterium]MBU0787374.1 ATP-binding cassette domain-containing protein [Gammaproteobacteria bacterium]MBU0816459.1 ATP-binding cassette domain-containing protein [Gammaproteobacteria bacterium]MBU1787653.1 ATP-binding cassette domain-containing protein [Gammaproteobacteria bacterium]